MNVIPTDSGDTFAVEFFLSGVPERVSVLLSHQSVLGTENRPPVPAASNQIQDHDRRLEETLGEALSTRKG
jgi:hypothetical protein